MGSVEQDLMRHDRAESREQAYEEALEKATHEQIDNILSKPLEPEFSEAVEALTRQDALAAIAKDMLQIHGETNSNKRNNLYHMLGCRLSMLILERIEPIADRLAKMETKELSV